MNIGIFGSASTVDGLRDQVANAQRLGFGSFWNPQIFDLDALTTMHGHLGMRAMRQRAVEAGGHCVVSPNQPSGTRVNIWVPRRPGSTRTQPLTAQERAG